MANTNKRYVPEFKKQMVRLVLEEGRTIASVNTAYNIGEGTVRSWIRQFEEECEKNPEANEKGELYEENHKEFGVRWLLCRFRLYPNSYYNYKKN